MKKVQLLLMMLLFIASVNTSYAQLYIDGENNVAVGSDSVSSDAKMKILTDTENTSLKIDNNTNSSGPKFGININLNESGSFPKYGLEATVNQNANASSEVLPFRARVFNHGTGSSTGFMSIVEPHGTGDKNGFFARITQPTGGTGTIKGAYNEITQNGTASHTYGIHNNVSQNGTTGTTYGLSNTIITNSSGTTYGSYNHIYGSGSGDKVALLAWAGGNDPSKNIAAQFYGKVYINGVLLQASDEKIKTNIKDVSGALAIIDKMKPKKYKFKNSPYSGTNPNLEQYGFLAQDVEEVLPDQVKNLNQQGRRKVKENNGNGNSSDAVEYEQLEPDEDIKAVNYIALIPILTQAIKEQQAIIEDLEKRLKKLEKK